MSDGHPEVRTGKEHVLDFGDVTDDGEVQLNLPREEEIERNLSGEDVRDLPGDTASAFGFGSVSDKSGGTVLVGAPEWGSTEVDHARSATSGY